MKQTIEHNAAIIRRLHDELKSAFRRRNEDGGVAWRRAIGELGSRYDALAFPGGRTAAFERLRVGDALTAETAIIYLEVRPYFFRSQYHASKFIRLLKRMALRPDLQKRLDDVLAAAHERKMRKRCG